MSMHGYYLGVIYVGNASLSACSMWAKDLELCIMYILGHLFLHVLNGEAQMR